MKTVSGRKVPIIKYEPDFRVIRHLLCIIELALLFLSPAKEVIVEGFRCTWLDKIIFK